jgi:hypothetical protein
MHNDGYLMGKHNTDRTAFWFIALGIFSLIAWVAPIYYVYILLYPLSKYAAGGPKPWTYGLMFPFYTLIAPTPWNIVAWIGFALIFTGLFRLGRALLLRSRRKTLEDPNV